MVEYPGDLITGALCDSPVLFCSVLFCLGAGLLLLSFGRQTRKNVSGVRGDRLQKLSSRSKTVGAVQTQSAEKQERNTGENYEKTVKEAAARSCMNSCEL